MIPENDPGRIKKLYGLLTCGHGLLGEPNEVVVVSLGFRTQIAAFALAPQDQGQALPVRSRTRPQSVQTATALATQVALRKVAE